MYKNKWRDEKTNIKYEHVVIQKTSHDRSRNEYS